MKKSVFVLFLSAMLLFVCILPFSFLPIAADDWVTVDVYADSNLVRVGDIVTFSVSAPGSAAVTSVYFEPTFDPAYFTLLTCAASADGVAYSDYDSDDGNGVALWNEATVLGGTFVTFTLRAEKATGMAKVGCSVIYTTNVGRVPVSGDTRVIITEKDETSETLPPETSGDETRHYLMIEKSSGVFDPETDTRGIRFRSEAEFANFMTVTVDGVELERNQYDAYKGSTAVVLRVEYLKTLAPGKHTLRIVSDDGYAEATFRIKDTAAVFRVVLIAAAGFVFLVAAVVALKRAKRR